ncbi:MAG: DUF4129 domain-containing protein [Chloroflexi bacterium]|nr:DUF4129 domain-containing protein [Chloroflexota bacterium]PKB59372.1 MAG: hypothetical protein BZY83_02190 [SAR202 cluster bacterium Casp-Chloro-G2]
MSWRNNSVTAVAMFLETCALYLAFAAVSAVIDQPGILLPFWLVLLSLAWSFGFMTYILSVNVNPRIRGVIGASAGLPSLLFLVHMNTGAGFLPVDTLMSGDVQATVGIVGTLVWLMVIWWRGSTMAREDITLDAVRSAFLWGLGVLFITALVDSMAEERVVSGFLVIGFFAVGLLGLSLARFSSESGETHVMSREWVMPILVSVGAVVVLGLFISAIGLGGLDDVTRDTLSFGGTAGFWILRPLMLLMGLFAGVVVGFVNWLSGMFGGGDFTGLINAQAELDAFHQRLREQSEEKEASTALITALKWTALIVAGSIASFVVYRLFRSRRYKSPEGDVEETRESLFTWRRANDDLSGMLAGWWHRMFPVQDRDPHGDRQPSTPREFYHGFLALAARLGHPRRDWETPNEHQRGIWGLLPVDPVYRIVQRFQRSHYGKDEADNAGLQALGEDWTELNDFLKREEL